MADGFWQDKELLGLERERERSRSSMLFLFSFSLQMSDVFQKDNKGLLSIQSAHLYRLFVAITIRVT